MGGGLQYLSLYVCGSANKKCQNFVLTDVKAASSKERQVTKARGNRGSNFSNVQLTQLQHILPSIYC